MTKLLIRLFIKDSENTANEKVRAKYGILSGVVGIVLNVILSVFKMIFGAITRSVSIIADGANNIYVYSISDNNLSLLTSSPDGIYQLALSPDGGKLAAACGVNYINGQNTVTYFGGVLY